MFLFFFLNVEEEPVRELANPSEFKSYNFLNVLFFLIII